MPKNEHLEKDLERIDTKHEKDVDQIHAKFDKYTLLERYTRVEVLVFAGVGAILLFVLQKVLTLL